MAGIKDASLLALTLLGFANANGRTGNSGDQSLGLANFAPKRMELLQDMMTRELRMQDPMPHPTKSGN